MPLINIWGQDKEVLTLEKLYQDQSSHLLVQKVIETDSIGISSLKKKIKNWIGLTFRSAENVLVNETEDQLVLIYLSKSLKANTGISILTMPWYIRSTIELKPNKIRISIFDDMGSGTPEGTGIPSRTYYLSVFFKKDGEMKMRNTYKDGFLNFKLSLNSMVASLEKALKENQKSDDW